MSGSAPPVGVTLGPRGLRVAAGEADLPLWAGALDHFRVPPRLWGAGLRALREIGFTLVETSVPWGVHERAPGQLDLTGPKDLGAFLDACAGEGLRAIVRVGPRTGGELLYEGLPSRIVERAELQARTAAGHPSWIAEVPRAFPAPSYAARRFLDEVRAYYAALAPALAPRLHPRGPVVLLGVDHALGGFLRAGPFDFDYHEEAIARWHDEEGAAPPPRRFDAQGVKTAADLAPILRWLAFRERQSTAALTALAALLDEVGLGGVPRAHGFSALEPVTWDAAAAERAVDLAGAHLLGGAADYARTRRRAEYLAGSSRLPTALPLAMGASPFLLPSGDADAIALLLGALMHGAAGYTARMAAGRDRWIGGAVDEDGRVRPTLGGPLAKLHAALAAARWTGLSRPADIGLLVPRDYGRLGHAASRLGPLAHLGPWLRLDGVSARTDPFGLAGPVAAEAPRAEAALAAALRARRLPFVRLDESAADAQLAARKLLVVPTFDFLDAPLAARLRRYEAHGGRLLSGPRAPTLDAAMQQADVALPGGRFDAALLDDADALGGALAAAAAAAGCCTAISATDRGGDKGAPPIDAALHARADGAPALLFLANGAGQARTAALDLPAGASAAVDALTGERLAGATLTATLAPWAVRLFTVE